MSEFEQVVIDGRTYHLGCTPTPDSVRKMFSPLGLPSIPESEWLEVNRREEFHRLLWYPDQINTNGCTGFSSAMVVSKARFVTGQPPIKLSGAYAYSLVNNNQDEGSNIGEALQALRRFGCATEASCDIHKSYDWIWRKNTKKLDAEAARFKVSPEGAVTIGSAEEAATAIQQGGILEFALRAHRKFGQLNSEGVLTFVAGGANHAVHADGLKKTNTHGWCLDMQTWTPNFADRSRGYWPLEWIDRTGWQDMWAVFGVEDDPEDIHDPPEPIA
jgi:hypothetical protein